MVRLLTDKILIIKAEKIVDWTLQALEFLRLVRNPTVSECWALREACIWLALAANLQPTTIAARMLVDDRDAHGVNFVFEKKSRKCETLACWWVGATSRSDYPETDGLSTC